MRTDHVIEVLEVRTVEPHEVADGAAELPRGDAGLPEREPARVLPASA